MIFDFDFRFLGLPSKTIDIERIAEFINDSGTKRINFALWHKNALRPSQGNIAGWLNLPFDEPFESIARKELGLNKVLFEPKSGSSYYRRIDTQEEYDKIQNLISKYENLVFLRDCLDLSVSLSMHDFISEDTGYAVRTELGQHEYEVKYNSGVKDTTTDLQALIAEMQLRLEQLPYFNLADIICAVPSSKPFMKDIISALKGFNFADVSDKISWANKNDSLKNAETSEDKLKMIDTWGLTIDASLDLKGKTILLVDDMYQSGITMQYVAMKLKDAGVKRVFGMTLCKALGNN